MTGNGQRCRRRVVPSLMAGVLTVSGCDVSVEDDEWDAERDRLLDETLVVDVADPPTRADLTIPDDSTRTVLERDDGELFEVTVLLRDGHRLRTPARAVGVTTGGPGEPPEELVIRRDDLSRADLRAALDSAVSDFGADRGRVEAVLGSASSTTEGHADLIRSIPTAIAGAAELTVEAIVTASEGRISANYYVSWDPS